MSLSDKKGGVSRVVYNTFTEGSLSCKYRLWDVLRTALGSDDRLKGAKVQIHEILAESAGRLAVAFADMIDGGSLEDEWRIRFNAEWNYLDGSLRGLGMFALSPDQQGYWNDRVWKIVNRDAGDNIGGAFSAMFKNEREKNMA